MKLFLWIVFFAFILMNSTMSFALDDEAPDTGVSNQPKSSGVTIVPAHSRDRALSSKSSTPIKKEKPAKRTSQTEPATLSQSETSSTPPGLTKKGELSKGLQKKDKVLSGWGKDLFKEKEDLFGAKNKEKSGKEKHKSFGKTFGTDEK